MKDKFEELGLDFVNEADAEELAEDEGLSLDEVEQEHFGDEEVEESLR